MSILSLNMMYKNAHVKSCTKLHIHLWSLHFMYCILCCSHADQILSKLCTTQKNEQACPKWNEVSHRRNTSADLPPGKSPSTH
jgi:hypothetical protein